MNVNLVTFKLVNFRMSAKTWEVLGKGMGNAKNLRNFAANACNLYQDDNLRRLLNGMIQDVDTKAGKRLQIKQDDQLHASRVYKAELIDEEMKQPPFTYSKRVERVKKEKKETNRQKLAHAPPSFGASIETLDFSDNELNDMHGLHIVSLIKS